MCGYRGLLTAAVLGVLAAVGLPVKAEIVIDDFSAPDSSVVTVINLLNPDPTLIKTSDGSILGGERDVLVDVQGNPSFISYAGIVGGGSLEFASSGPAGTAATLQYDGLDADVVGPPAQLVNAEGLGGMDLTSYGSKFYFDFLWTDPGSEAVIDILIRVNSIAQSSTFSGGIPGSSSPLTFLAPFSSFSNLSVFQNVTSIEVILNSSGGQNVDFELDTFGIPEPATLSLLGLGVVAALGRRKKG